MNSERDIEQLTKFELNLEAKAAASDNDFQFQNPRTIFNKCLDRWLASIQEWELKKSTVHHRANKKQLVCILSQLTVFPQGIVSLPLQSDGFRPEVDGPDTSGSCMSWTKSTDGGASKPVNLARINRYGSTCFNEIKCQVQPTCKVKYSITISSVVTFSHTAGSPAYAHGAAFQVILLLWGKRRIRKVTVVIWE